MMLIRNEFPCYPLSAEGGLPYRARKLRENSGRLENPQATAISRMLMVE